MGIFAFRRRRKEVCGLTAVDGNDPNVIVACLVGLVRIGGLRHNECDPLSIGGDIRVVDATDVDEIFWSEGALRLSV